MLSLHLLSLHIHLVPFLHTFVGEQKGTKGVLACYWSLKMPLKSLVWRDCYQPNGAQVKLHVRTELCGWERPPHLREETLQLHWLATTQTRSRSNRLVSKMH